MAPVKLLIKTYSFIILRFLLGACLFFVGYKCFMWGIELTDLFGLNMLLTDLLFGYVGISLFIMYISFAKKILFHFVGYAHVAAMTHVLHGKDIGMVSAFKVMLQRFGSVSAMYVVDGFMRKVVKQVSSWIVEKGNFLPKIFKKGLLASLASSALNTIIFSVLEVIVSYLYRNKETGLWDGALKGTSLYVQSWKHVLKYAFINAITLKVFSWILSIVIVGVSAWYLWGQSITVILTVFLNYKIITSLTRLALVEPYQTASMLTAFWESVKDKNPDECVAAKLSDVCDKFKELVFKGKEEGSELSDRVASILGDSLVAENVPLVSNNSVLKTIVKEVDSNA